VSVRQLVRFFPTVAAIGLILAGCSGGHVVYETSSHHAFPTVRQTSGVEAHPVQGIDIAKYQGDVDFQRVRDSGVSFVFIKATEGGDHLDSRFRENWDKARAAGLPRGAYHFAYWCRPMKEQAAWFIANVPNDPDAMPPVLDVEWNNDSQSCRRKVPKEEALLEMRDFLWAVEAHYGKKPIIYADYNFHKDIMADGHFGSYPFWVRSVKHLPHDRFNRTWTFWQYTANCWPTAFRHQMRQQLPGRLRRVCPPLPARLYPRRPLLCLSPVQNRRRQRTLSQRPIALRRQPRA